jgi:hypothetical protein
MPLLSNREGRLTQRKGTPMRLLNQWAARYHRGLRPVGPGGDAPPPASTPEPPPRVMLTPDDLLWFKTSEDDEGRITVGLLACSPESIGVLVDDNGESLGLRLSRAEAQDLHRTLVAWLAGPGRIVPS